MQHLSCYQAALAAVFLLACHDNAGPLEEAAGGSGGIGRVGPVVIWPPLEGDMVGDQKTRVDSDNPWLLVNTESDAVEEGTSASESTASVGAGVGESTPVLKPPANARIRGYLETTSAKKALLIENIGLEAAVGCVVRIYSNGGSEPWRSYQVMDVPVGGRALLCVPEAFSDACTGVHSGSSFNGDDAVTLECGGETIDQVGIIGVDPGAAWEGAGQNGQVLSTKDAGIWQCTNSREAGLEPSSQAEEEFSFADFVSWDWRPGEAWNEPSCPQIPTQSGGGAGGDAGG